MLSLRAKLSVLAATVVAAAGALTVIVAAPAAAHGAMLTPGSRTYLCYVDGHDSTGQIRPTNPACQNAMSVGGAQPFYDWFGVLRSDGAGRTRGFIPDGSLCSGGYTKFAGFDAPRSDWPLTHLTSGASRAFQYSNWAAHPGTFYLYVTKDGYNPNQALTWANLEEQPFLSVTNPPQSSPAPNGYYYWNGNLPAGKSGRHVIYSVWSRSDSTETFYGCSDVVFDGGNGEVTGIKGNPIPPSPSVSPSASRSPSVSPSASRSPSVSPSASRSQSASPSASASQSPQTGTSCAATFALTNGWSNGFQGEITVRNTGTTALNGWTVRATFANGQTVNQSWSSTYTQSGAVASFKSVSWNAALAVNGSASYGFLAASNGTNTAPSLACTSP